MCVCLLRMRKRKMHQVFNGVMRGQIDSSAVRRLISTSALVLTLALLTWFGQQSAQADHNDPTLVPLPTVITDGEAISEEMSVPSEAPTPAADPAEANDSRSSASPHSADNSFVIYMPQLSYKMKLSERMGFARAKNSLNVYPDVPSFKAGWYLDWNVSVTPDLPNGMQYMQMVRMHQKLACPFDSPDAFDRVKCPALNDYAIWPDVATIQAAAKANPGSVWLLGNEMDRRDWKACQNETCTEYFTAHQDEMAPEIYARAYYDLHKIIKEADPKARIAIGGIIQPTPLRLQYLSLIWDSYKALYGSEMPVDVWNFHMFALREQSARHHSFAYGADVPPGAAFDNVAQGAYAVDDCDHMSRVTFDKQVRDMRQWMKDRGQQNKPLIVTEYGVLYHTIYTGSCGNLALEPANAASVVSYMLWSFDYFMNTKDASLGYPADDYRLVQMWNWFSLDHQWLDVDGTPRGALNIWASLFNSTNKAITDAGKSFRDFSLIHMSNLQLPAAFRP